MITERLRFLYGDEMGGWAAAALDRLLADYRPRLPPPRQGVDRFDERDAILITYGDTFLAPGATPLAVLNDFARRHLAGRLSGIHVLPFFPYSSDYGFSVVDYQRVNPRLGTWGDIRALSSRFRLMFDLVLNHVSVQNEWFRGFLRGERPYDKFFIAVDPQMDLSMVTRPRTSPLLTRFDTARGPRWIWTTFSADQVDLDYHSPEVLLRMIEIMLEYVERGADILRLDAIGFLWKEIGTSCLHLPQSHEVVKLFREVLDLVAPNVAIVTETNVPHRDNISYFGDGYDEAQMVYQFPLAPLVIDALARGNASRLATWAAGLSTPSQSTTFFNFLASHDGIGIVPAKDLLSDQEVEGLTSLVRKNGGEVSYKKNPDGSDSAYELNTTFFDALSDPADVREAWRMKLDRFICAHSIVLALAGVPGIYAHSLFGSHNYHEGYARSGWKRDLNHEQLDLMALERALADPNSDVAQVFFRITRLLEARGSQPAFHPDAPQHVLPLSDSVFAVRRGPRQGEALLALHNVTPHHQVVEGGVLSRYLARSEDVLGGRRVAADEPVSLEPYEVLWLRTGGARVV